MGERSLLCLSKKEAKAIYGKSHDYTNRSIETVCEKREVARATETKQYTVSTLPHAKQHLLNLLVVRVSILFEEAESILWTEQ